MTDVTYSIDFMSPGEDYCAASKEPIHADLVETLAAIKTEFERMLKEDGAHPLFRGVDFEARLVNFGSRTTYDPDDMPPKETITPLNTRYGELGQMANCWLDLVDVSEDEDGESGEIVLELSHSDVFGHDAWLVLTTDIYLSRWESLIRELRKMGILSEGNADSLEWAVE